MGRNKSSTSLSRIDRKKQHTKKGLFAFLLLISFSLVGMTGYAALKVNHFVDKIYDSSNSEQALNNNQDVKGSDPIDEQKNVKKESFAILLLGEDYRVQTGSKNTDAILVSVWNPNTKQISLLSIPRDTRIQISGQEYGKINSVYAKKGHSDTMNILSNYLNIPIKYYVKIDFHGFEDVIDELGGIKIDVERNMFYQDPDDGTNIQLQKGLQVLNGKEALDYARFRKSSDGHDSSDFERNERHQKIIKVLVDKLTSITGLMNGFDLLDIVGDHMKTNLNSEEMKNIFFTFKSIEKDDIHSIKMDSYWENPYVHVEQEELNRVQQELQNAYDQTKETNAKVSNEDNK